MKEPLTPLQIAVYAVNCPNTDECADEVAGAITRLIDDKQKEIDNLKTCMIAAAEEIQAHWQAHCDKDGYGPANLMHRLEKGIPAQYGYTAGAFERLQEENEVLKEQVKTIRLFIKNGPNSGEPPF